MLASGFDWIFVDLEHGAIGIEAAQQLAQLCNGRAAAVVRVPENSEVWIKKMLDLGYDGVVVPQVNSAEEARAAVASAKYPPLGCRSVGIARAHKYGAEFQEYVATANESTSVIVQIEHITAVENAESIVTVEGVDAAFIGPYDLSGSMNRLGDVAHADVQNAIARAFDVCKANGLPVGIFAANVEIASSLLNKGYDFIAVGMDMSILANAAKSLLGGARATP